MSTITSANPAPPPTLNNLDPRQRTRLLRSTRKLEALLGTTPYLLEPSSKSSHLRTPSSAPTPASATATRTHRRERHALGASSTSSHSSKYDVDRGDFLVNHAQTPLSLERPFSAFELVPDISPNQEAASLGDKRGRLTKKNSLNKGSQAKSIVTKGVDGSRTKPKVQSQDSKPNKETHSIPFSHPLVLSLLAVPVSQSDARLSPGHTTLSLPHPSPSSRHSSSSSKPSSSHDNSPLSPPTFAANPDTQTLALPSTPTTPGTPIPLTPLSPTFYSNQSDSSEREKERERDVRRKKIAKLTRTLGENVPPELVFHTAFVKLEKDLSLRTRTPTTKPKPSTTPKHRSKSQYQSQSVQTTPASHLPSSSKPKPKPPPASGPPIVVIGPPPAPGTRRNRKSPSSPQSQKSQSETHLSTELVIPPQPSTPAPLPPSALVEKYRLEREKAKEMLTQAHLSPTSAHSLSSYTYRPRSLSLGSGIDLLGKYWASELDGKRGSGASGSGSSRKVDERQKIGETEPNASEAQQWSPSVPMVFHPNPYIQLPPPSSPTVQYAIAHKTHRHVYSTPSPQEPYFTIPYKIPTPSPAPAPTANPSPPLLRKSSKSKGKAASSTKAGVERSNSIKGKNQGGVEVEVEVVRSVESDEGFAWHGAAGRTRSGTPRPSDGSGTSALLLTPPECGRRKEREWSGEWNRNDMDEVVKALRGLKSR